MKRNLTENLPRPTAGCLSVPLFNQKRRSRLPLTSNPSESEFCRTPSNEFPSVESFASSSLSSGNSGCSDSNGPSYTMSARQNSSWNKQGGFSDRPAASSTGRGLAPLPHPNKPGNVGPQMGQQRSAPWQGTSAQPNAKPCSFPNSRGNVQYKPKPSHPYLQTGQQSAYRQPSPPASFHPQPPQRPVATPPNPHTAAGQWQDSTWKFKTTAHSSQFKEDSLTLPTTKTFSQSQKSAASQIKPAVDNSLRILTTAIGGVKHWSQYKDRAAFLFEVFATLDSAVTVGSHGAKSFLLRDGKDVVHCVFYETDRELPRLIRGQVHRCVGNYDRGRDLLTCVSVRPASSSEQRNAQESVRASDAEMRRLVKTFSEI
ncbi:spermatogenesis-associated protein 22 isoform X1 [Conger conger]|uniref:spermatogenesis-associated protein 22 isoform X1 n=1 Tax=Conger conger TaxID=82655 RepID=UPI002A5A3B38|nr:spermatogenesis-associated protein 22 isoform X1 [Conger conger]XP_061106006.1 spermatogenesis-associated protein 22 isoform X1 [Conger conger]